jgi:hypothetical protein
MQIMTEAMIPTETLSAESRAMRKFPEAGSRLREDAIFLPERRAHVQATQGSCAQPEQNALRFCFAGWKPETGGGIEKLTVSEAPIGRRDEA